jgi:GNAT superfamily N-acetyltransferase
VPALDDLVWRAPTPDDAEAIGRMHHGSGLARALAEQALGDGPAELWLFDGNPRAEAFYRKLGFERDGVEAPHRETGLHGIRMVRGG